MNDALRTNITVTSCCHLTIPVITHNIDTIQIMHKTITKQQIEKAKKVYGV